jgi:hypothetical protein
MANPLNHAAKSIPWNAHRIIGLKPLLKPKDIWAIRQRPPRLELSAPRHFSL